ncbi:MAG TPA: hypothetical protein VHC97_23310 [Thermoanaerobaculia bacterium]|nr:hypothetical protein [Thermoanaerobaculia bacterium]
MKAHKLKVTVPEDHQLEIRLPDDFPSGPAEVIVLAGPAQENSRRDMLLVLDELRTLQRTDEEERVLDEFEQFRQEHPFNLSSLTDER